MTTLPASQDIFTRISDPSEKSRLFYDLSSKRGEIQAKMPEPSADVFVLMAYDYSDKKIHCKINGATTPILPQGSLISTFFVGGEKYFFNTDYKSSGDQISLLTQNPLFHLQRREDYRVKIPASYRALFEIVSVNGKTDKRSILLMDLSGGGCRIQVDPKVLGLKMQDELKGHLFLPDRSPIPVTGSVRHTRIDPHGKGPMVCGIQFVGLTEPMKNRIIAVVMDLYRELFAGRN